MIPQEFADFSGILLKILIAVILSALIAAKIIFLRKKVKISTGKIIVAISIIYFLIFSSLSVLKHESFNSTAFDLGIFDQNVWMLSKGMSEINTINGFHAFSDHVQPILFVFALLYMIVASPLVLIILQALAVSIGAFAIYLLAKRKLNENLALIFAIAYLLYPATQYLILFDFHTESLLMVFLLFAVFFLEKRSYKKMFLFLLLAGLTKEYIPSALIFFGAYILFFQKNRKVAAFSAAIGIIWLFVNYGIITSYTYNSLGIYSTSYGEDATLLGKGISAIAGVFTLGKLGYVLLMLIPLAGISLLGLEMLVLAIPGFTLLLLKTETTYTSIGQHHGAFITPFIFSSAILGFKRLKILGRKKRFAGYVLLFASVISFVAYGPFTTLYNAETFNPWSIHSKVGHEIIGMIPEDAVVSSTTWAVPHLSERNKIYMFPGPFHNYSVLPDEQLTIWFNATPEYIVLDTSRKDIMLDEELVREQECNVAKSGDYSLVYDADGWVLLEKSEGKSPVERLCRD